MATASQKITLLPEIREEFNSYLIRFLDLILGALIADPTKELPVKKIPLVLNAS